MPSAIDDLVRQIEEMDPAARKELEKLAAEELHKPWLPQEGPQTEAYFSDADLTLYGGAAGGGKTDLIVGLGLNRHHRVGVFRQQAGELQGLIDRMNEVLSGAGMGQVTGTPPKWDGGDGKKFEFGHLEKPRSEKSWQGRDHDLKAFDEAAQISPEKILFVSSWSRSTRPGQRCRILLCSNPPMGGDGDYLLEWFGPWLDPTHPLYGTVSPGELLWAVFISDGSEVRSEWIDEPSEEELAELNAKALQMMEAGDLEGLKDLRIPKSRTFIPARMSDNKYLGAGYLAEIASKPEPLRTALLTGDFLAGRQDHEYQVIPSDWVDAAMDRWEESGRSKPMDVIGVDVAQGGADKTTLAPLHGGNWFDKIHSVPGKDTRDGAEVGALVINRRRSNALIAVDCTGGWGGDTVGFLQRENSIPCEAVVFSKASGAHTREGNIPFFNLRAEMYWKFREALHPKSGEDIALPRSQKLKAQLTAPRWKLQGKAIIIESKDDIRERILSSPDEADAVVIAFANRGKAIMRRMDRDKAMTECVASEDPFAEL